MPLLTKEEIGSFASLVLVRDERALEICHSMLKRSMEIIAETDPDHCDEITRGIVNDIRRIIQKRN